MTGPPDKFSRSRKLRLAQPSGFRPQSVSFKVHSSSAHVRAQGHHHAARAYADALRVSLGDEFQFDFDREMEVDGSSSREDQNDKELLLLILAELSQHPELSAAFETLKNTAGTLMNDRAGPLSPPRQRTSPFTSPPLSHPSTGVQRRRICFLRGCYTMGRRLRARTIRRARCTQSPGRGRCSSGCAA